MKKRIVALIMAGVMALGLAACGSGADSAASAASGSAGDDSAAASAAASDSGSDAAAPATGDIKVVGLAGDLADESLVYMFGETEKKCAEKGWDYQTMDGQSDPTKQSQQLANCISEGVTAVVLNPSDSAAIGPAIMEAQEAGIITCFISADIDEMYGDYRDVYCGPNDTDSGVLGAKALMEALPDGGKVVEVGGQASHIAATLRHEGFEATIDGSNIECLDTQYCQDWNTAQAMAIMEDFITRYGDEIDGVYCHWDNGVSGCIEAFKNAGLDIPPIVGVDGCQAGYDQVDRGEQYASIANSYDEMTDNLVEYLETRLSGGDYNALVEDGWWFKQDWYAITKDNIGDYERPSW